MKYPSLVIQDDTCRRNQTLMVTPEMRGQAIKLGRPIPDHVTHLEARDKHGKVVQRTVITKVHFNPARLEFACKRARRFIRSKRFRQPKGMPHHIALAMAAFHKAFPKEFNALIKERLTA